MLPFGRARHLGCGLVGGKTTGVAKEADLVAVKVAIKKKADSSYMIAGMEYVVEQKLNNTEQPMVAVMAISHPPLQAM